MHDFVPLKIVAVCSETPAAVTLALAVPEEGRDAFRFRPGQHLAVRAVLAGEEVRRTYSICSGPNDPHLAIAIKRIAGGRFSNWACDTLTPGMTLEAMRPQGRFVLPDPPGERRHVLAFAAGVGITPIVAMIEHALRRQPGVRCTLVYANRDADSIMFRERLEDLKDTHLERFTLLHVLSRNDESETPLLEGRLTAAKIAALAGPVFQVEDVDHVFLCGPGGMIREVRNGLVALGMPRERVHHELFMPVGMAASAATEPALSAASGVVPAAGGGRMAVAVLDGVRHRFPVEPGETIVDAAIRAGVRAPYACKGGMCSTCRARVVEGSAPMRLNYSLESWEVERGFVLTCQAVPETASIVIDYDQM